MRFTVVVLLTVVTGFFTAARAGDIEGKVAGMKGKSVVYVDTIGGKSFPAPTDHPVIDQKGLMFSPNIVVVQQGTTVDFKNDDNVAHNVFWPSIGGDKKLTKNLGTWPKGEKRSFTFDRAGVVPLLCNVHPDMAGYLIVSPTPYFAQTDESGNYKIKDVPDGSYKVVVWHEGARNQSKPVTVAGGGKADFTVSK
ncbi:MAG TPA: carboxypeptidase regulatory-like domain-containing protein [Candidatus Sulfotelmatobacter sp.]|nr:carboxypeptidase regulatory-like domain-containing protein [Candidatus Sulfotelmatobacter sp.]